MPTVRTDDGTTIAYRTRGDGPRALLFMHGFVGSGAFWDETLEHLDLTGLRAITYDLRGHGGSDKPATGYTVERFARGVGHREGVAGAGQFVVVGYSMAGKFAQYLACLHPERVAGQVLVAGCTAGEFPLPPEVQRDWVGRAGDRARLLELERQFITRPVAPAVLERWVDAAAKAPAAALDATLTMCVRESFLDRLVAVSVPTLVIGGLHDPSFTPDVLRQSVVAAHLGARLALLDCNHTIPAEQPLELAAVLAAFLAEPGEDRKHAGAVRDETRDVVPV